MQLYTLCAIREIFLFLSLLLFGMGFVVFLFSTLPNKLPDLAWVPINA